MPLHEISHIDIKKDVSKYSIIVIDTNVLLFIHGGYSLRPKEHAKANTYANFISDLIANDIEIIIPTISLQELFHVIETKEYNLYLAANPSLKGHFTKKDFRANQLLRTSVMGKIKSVYKQIEATYKIDNYNEIKKEHIIDFINTYNSHKFDPMDYSITKNYDCYAKLYYVTDDKDFLSNTSLEIISC